MKWRNLTAADIYPFVGKLPWIFYQHNALHFMGTVLFKKMNVKTIM